MRESEKNEIVVVDKEMTVRSNDYGYPFYRRGTVYGIVSGILMSVFALLISGVATAGSPVWDFLKYIVLGVALWMILTDYKPYLPTGKVFKEGMKLGLYTSFVAAVTMFAVNVLVSLIGVEAAVQQKLGMEADSVGNILVINGLMIFVTLAFGVITTFIHLQFLKERSTTNE